MSAFDPDGHDDVPPRMCSSLRSRVSINHSLLTLCTSKTCEFHELIDGEGALRAHEFLVDLLRDLCADVADRHDGRTGVRQGRVCKWMGEWG